MTDTKRDDTETVRVVVKHHSFVRLSHWLNVPLLLGLIASGLSIYWAAPVYEHARNARTGSTDYVADIGAWAVTHAPAIARDPMPGAWVYNQFGLGIFRLAQSLRLHWFF